MNNKIKPLIAGVTLLLFALSCDMGPKADSTEGKNSETEVSVNMEDAEVMKIAELVDNMGKLEGKTVQITGSCTKLNIGILDRNWIHLKDGSKDDYDLIITSDVTVPEGNVVTMTGVVVLNKDFGAGYSYELILEEGKIIR